MVGFSLSVYLCQGNSCFAIVYYVLLTLKLIRNSFASVDLKAHSLLNLDQEWAPESNEMKLIAD